MRGHYLNAPKQQKEIEVILYIMLGGRAGAGRSYFLVDFHVDNSKVEKFYTVSTLPCCAQVQEHPLQ